MSDDDSRSTDTTGIDRLGAVLVLVLSLGLIWLAIGTAATIPSGYPQITLIVLALAMGLVALGCIVWAVPGSRSRCLPENLRLSVASKPVWVVRSILLLLSVVMAAGLWMAVLSPELQPTDRISLIRPLTLALVASCFSVLAWLSLLPLLGMIPVPAWARQLWRSLETLLGAAFGLIGLFLLALILLRSAQYGAWAPVVWLAVSAGSLLGWWARGRESVRHLWQGVGSFIAILLAAGALSEIDRRVIPGENLRLLSSGWLFSIFWGFCWRSLIRGASRRSR